jgi:hypothetical protein
VNTVPTDTLSRETANHILALVREYAWAAEDYVTTLASTPDSGWPERRRVATEVKDAAHHAVVTAVLDCVDWQAEVAADIAARLAAMPAPGEDL